MIIGAFGYHKNAHERKKEDNGKPVDREVVVISRICAKPMESLQRQKEFFYCWEISE